MTPDNIDKPTTGLAKALESILPSLFPLDPEQAVIVCLLMILSSYVIILILFRPLDYPCRVSLLLKVDELEKQKEQLEHRNHLLRSELNLVYRNTSFERLPSVAAEQPHLQAPLEEGDPRVRRGIRQVPPHPVQPRPE